MYKGGFVLIKVKIPANNVNERKYIISILLNEFLGLNYYVILCDSFRNWEIILENGNKLIIEDQFFNKFPKELEYLKNLEASYKLIYNFTRG